MEYLRTCPRCYIKLTYQNTRELKLVTEVKGNYKSGLCRPCSVWKIPIEKSFRICPTYNYNFQHAENGGGDRKDLHCKFIRIAI